MDYFNDLFITFLGFESGSCLWKDRNVPDFIPKIKS